MSMFSIDDAGFDDVVLRADQTVLVDFWAERCLPCVLMTPTLEDLAGELADRLTIVQLNVDENTTTALRYGVNTLPTLMIFKAGQPAATLHGSAPKGRLTAWVRANL